MTDNPYSTPVTPMAGADSVSLSTEAGSWQTVTQPMRDVAGWSRFLGITMIVIGVLYCLSIVGVIVGWLPIWLGILLLKSGDNLKVGTAETTLLGLEQQAKSIRILGVSSIVFLTLMVLYVFLVFTVLFLAQAPAPAVPPAAPPLPTAGP